jgi:hypothetical protein
VKNFPSTDGQSFAGVLSRPLEENEVDPEIEVVYESLQQPRTLSRDSGCATPSPTFGNVSTKDNQKKVPVKFDSLVIINMKKSKDELLVSEECEEYSLYLKESEDSENEKLMMSSECEGPVPTRCDTEEVPVKFDSLVIINMKNSKDELLVREECNPYLEEFEDSENKKLLMGSECEDPVPTSCDTEEASVRETVSQCAVCER